MQKSRVVLVAFAALSCLAPSIVHAQEPIGSITVKFVNKTTRQPLVSGVFPFPFAFLERCLDATCDSTQYATEMPTDATGTSTVSMDADGNALPSATYIVAAYTGEAEGEITESPPFFVAAGQHYRQSHGAIGADIAFLITQPCEHIPATGGVCELGVTVTNGAYPKRRIRGKAWIIGFASLNRDVQSFSIFQMGGLKAIDLPAGGSVTLTFRLSIPASVPGASHVCVLGHVGQGPVPQLNPIFQEILRDPRSDYSTEYCFGKVSDPVS